MGGRFRWIGGLKGSNEPSPIGLSPPEIPDDWLGNIGDAAHLARAASHRGDETTVRKFLDGGPLSLARRDRSGRDLLTLAVEAGEIECPRLLAGAGAGMKSQAPSKETLLMRAVIRGHVPVAQELISLGVDIEAVDEHGGTAIHRAASNR